MTPASIVFRTRDRVHKAVTAALERGAVVDGFQLARATDAALSALPKRAKYDAVFRSLSALSGVVPTADQLRTLSWALSADREALFDGRPVTPGRLAAGTEVLIQVTATHKFVRFGTNEPAAQFRGKVLSGPGAPTDTDWRWSLRFVAYVASNPDGLGFDRKQKPNARHYRHYSTLFGMRFATTLKDVNGRIGVDSVRCPPVERDRNRQLIDMRLRRGFDCPLDYEHHCDLCPKGQSTCPAACRTADLIDRPCERCGVTFGFDPAWPPVCDRCSGAKRKGHR